MATYVRKVRDMSHRVTSKTNITNKALALQALQNAGWLFNENGNNVSITSGPMKGATLSLKDGTITGDTDWHDAGDDSLGAIRRYYAEAETLEELSLRGAVVESREITEEGEIRLICNGAFA